MTALPILLMTEEEVARFGRREEDAGFGALRTERGLLPLTAMDVDVRVIGVMAAIEVAQTFVNSTGTAIEATYIFPLPDRAAAHRFRMEVAGRVIEGVVDERGAAREQYDQAIASGHRAAITEQERPGVFTLRVGNLMPGEAATVRLSLVGPLPVDDGEVTFRFPLVVAPRYIPGAELGGDQAGLGTAADTNLVPDASRISPPVLLSGVPNPVRLGLRVAIEDAGARDVASSLHAVVSSLRDARLIESSGSAGARSTAEGRCGVSIEVRPGERLDRDFILRWRIDDRELRSTLVCADDADGRAGTFMLTFVPPSTLTVSAKPRDVVFVIDRSGSMEGWKMVAARRAVARMIDSLTSRDQFQVVAFDDRIEVSPYVRATDRNRFVAIETLAKIEARNGTELREPLVHALQQLAGGTDDRERVVVLVTDGQVGDEDHILRELAPRLRNVRMFTLGIDQAVNDGFLKRLASAGGGLCELVESEDRLDDVMAKVHRRIGRPLATELALRPTGLELERGSIAPRKLPDVYAGAPVVVLGRYRGCAGARASLEIEGTSLGDPLRLTVVRGTETGNANALAASWARAHIRELEDRYATGAHEVEPEIVAVSKRFGVLSRFTAYLAVDRAQVVNPGGGGQQVVQPVESPAGWQDASKSARARIQTAGGVFRPQPPAMMPSGPPPMPGQSSPIVAGAPSRSKQKSSPADAAIERKLFGSIHENEDVGDAAFEPHSGVDTMSFDSHDRFVPMDVDFSEELEAAPAEPAAPRPPKSLSAHAPARETAKSESSRAEAVAYLTTLAALARALEAEARGPCESTALRLLRQRLTELVEDLRSVGGHDDLADAVEREVKRLAAAITVGGELAKEALEVATELAKLATGTSPPTKRSRLAFWK